MDEASENHPPRTVVTANGFRGLKKVLQLGEIGVRVAVVDQRVEEFCGFPNPHLLLAETQILLLLFSDEIIGLMGVVLPIKLSNAGAGIFAHSRETPPFACWDRLG